MSNEKNRERRLRPAEALYKDLMQSQHDVIITPKEALAIWKIFRPDQLPVSHFNSISYRAFMQACMMSAREASSAMSWVEAIFRSAYKPNATIKGVLVALTKTAIKKYYSRAIGRDQELYTHVIGSIAWSHKSYFEMIANGLEI